MARILVISDVSRHRKTYEESLPLLGHDVTLVERVQTATQKLTEETYDLVIVDSSLLGSDVGGQIAEGLHKDEWPPRLTKKRTFVIITSERSSQVNFDRALVVERDALLRHLGGYIPRQRQGKKLPPKDGICWVDWVLETRGMTPSRLIVRGQQVVIKNPPLLFKIG